VLLIGIIITGSPGTKVFSGIALMIGSSIAVFAAAVAVSLIRYLR
jgi:hypothetical protein